MYWGSIELGTELGIEVIIEEDCKSNKGLNTDEEIDSSYLCFEVFNIARAPFVGESLIRFN